MFKKTKTTAPSALHFDLRDEDPAFDEWATKIRDFRALESKCDSKESDLLTRLRARPQKLADTVNVAVSKLLGDDVDENDPESAGLAKQLQEVQAQRRDLRAARAIAEQRQAAARCAASAKVCDRVADDYKARVSRLAMALVAAHEANAELYALTSALDAADVVWTGALRPMPAHRLLGEPHDRSNRVAAWLREAAEYGLIDKSIIPEGLKQ